MISFDEREGKAGGQREDESRESRARAEINCPIRPARDQGSKAKRIVDVPLPQRALVPVRYKVDGAVPFQQQ